MLPEGVPKENLAAVAVPLDNSPLSMNTPWPVCVAVIGAVLPEGVPKENPAPLGAPGGNLPMQHKQLNGPSGLTAPAVWPAKEKPPLGVVPDDIGKQR